MSHSPYINHFLQPDTIIPDPSNPQSWNRYSYVLNNPIRFIDPTGHMVKSDGDGGCQSSHKCRQEYLTRRSAEILKSLGGKDDNKAMRDIIKTAESVFHEYKDLLPALTEVFNGNNSAHMLTILVSAGAGPCDGLGRGTYDCPTNDYAFGDSGFHPDFWDNGNNQLFHVWPYIANVGGSYSLGGVGLTVAQGANWFHEYVTSQLSHKTDDGASWNDYFMSQAAMEIGVAIANGEVAPQELADFVYWRLGPQGPGSGGMVDLYTMTKGPLYEPLGTR